VKIGLDVGHGFYIYELQQIPISYKMF